MTVIRHDTASSFSHDKHVSGMRSGCGCFMQWSPS